MAHPDDELLSALLDGEAPSGDVAHVDGCAECQTRVEELQRAVAVMSAPVAMPPAHQREASLAAALTAADGPLRGAAISSFGRRIPNRTAARAARNRRANNLSAAAVLLVALAVGGLAISQMRDSGGDRPTSNASLAQGMVTSPDAAGGGEAATGAADDASTLKSGPADDTTMATTADAPTDLGPVDDIAVVSRRSTEDLNGRDATTESTLAYATLACPPEAVDEPVLWHAALTYKGTPSFATVRAHSETTRITEIRSQADCSLLASQEFEPTTPR